jgi:hypothetical protein
VRARHVALPVLEALPPRPVAGTVLGSGRDVAYVHVDGFVLALTGPNVPLMPNGVALDSPLDGSLRAATTVECSCARVHSGRAWIRWDGPMCDRWEPRPRPACATREAAGTLGHRMLQALGIDAGQGPDDVVAALLGARTSLTADPAAGGVALTMLFDSLLGCDPQLAQRAAAGLIGRGPGLTPEGDDIVAACAATLVVLRRALGLTEGDCAGWVDAARSALRPGRTTALSRTLLELACAGRVAEPLHDVLACAPHTREWEAAVQRMLRVGATTGTAYAIGVAATALLAGARSAPRPRSMEEAQC